MNPHQITKNDFFKNLKEEIILYFETNKLYQCKLIEEIEENLSYKFLFLERIDTERLPWVNYFVVKRKITIKRAVHRS